MSSILVYSLTGAALIGIGIYGFVRSAHLLRRLIAFNIVGSGVFLLFGAFARRISGAEADPVPQAIIITGIVVAFAATALGAALAIALEHKRRGASVEEVEGEEGNA